MTVYLGAFQLFGVVVYGCYMGVWGGSCGCWMRWVRCGWGAGDGEIRGGEGAQWSGGACGEAKCLIARGILISPNDQHTWSE